MAKYQTLETIDATEIHQGNDIYKDHVCRLLLLPKIKSDSGSGPVFFLFSGSGKKAKSLRSQLRYSGSVVAYANAGTRDKRTVKFLVRFLV